MRQTVRETTKRNLGKICVNCGSTESIEYHHIVPLVLGGNDTESNMVALCHQCHKAAHCGRRISHYRNTTNMGRKSKIDKEYAYPYMDKYINGEIGKLKIINTLADCNMNVQKTANKMNYHRNTIVYHLQKIENKTGLNPMNFYDLAKLLLKSKLRGSGIQLTKTR